MSATKEHFHNEIEAGMRKNHKIQWLNLPGYKGETWNPIIGCSKISDGCKNCYAEKMAARISRIELSKMVKGKKLSELSTKYNRVMAGNKWYGNTHFTFVQLYKPLKWKSPRIVFVCSMGDLFHEYTSFEEIDKVYDIMYESQEHIFIVLTKRAERMAEYYNYREANHWAVRHSWIWIGVTAENQEQANIRIPYLNNIPAEVKFVSVEPMLSEIALHEALADTLKYHAGGLKNCLSWVICGGESGHNARPVHPDWVLYLRNQCIAAGVPFFFKQWGEYKPLSTVDGQQILPFGKYDTETKFGFVKTGKHKSGNLLDGERYQMYPEFTPALKGERKTAESSSAPFRAGGENQHPVTSNKQPS